MSRPSIALDVETSNVTGEMIEGADEKVYCSQSCSRTWKWIIAVCKEVVSYGSNQDDKCEFQCNIRDKQSKLVHATEQKGTKVSNVMNLSYA